MPSNPLIAKVVLERGFATEEQLETCLRLLCDQPEGTTSLPQILLQQGVVTVPQYVELLRISEAQQHPAASGDETASGFAKVTTLELPKTPGGASPHGHSPMPELASEGSDTAEAERTFGRYPVLREIGRGGMGIVYLAQDPTLNRPVALKVLRREISQRNRAEHRFQREIEALLSIQHPNVVRLLDCGEVEGALYFAMDYVEGHSLEQLIREGRIGLQDMVDLTVRVAEALDACHEKGLLHRDIKPANILVDVRGNPYLTDFGLALDEAQDTRITQSGTLVGTPAYLAPEQTTTGEGNVDPRSDVYSLGVVLYEGLTGQLPYRAYSLMEMLRRIVNDRPQPMRKLRSDIPADLEAVCMTALEKDPRIRYQTAKALAEDLKRVTRGVAIHARPQGAAMRLRLLLRRHGRGGAAALALIALTALVTHYWITPPANGPRPPEDTRSSAADAAAQKEDTVLQLLETARVALSQGDLELAHRATLEVREASAAGPLASTAAALLARIYLERSQRLAGETTDAGSSHEQAAELAHAWRAAEAAGPAGIEQRVTAQTGLAQVAERRGLFPLAELLFRQASQEASDEPLARARLYQSRAFLAMGNYADAAYLAQMIIDGSWLDPNERLEAASIRTLGGALATRHPLGPPGTQGIPRAAVCLDGCGRPEILVTKGGQLSIVKAAQIDPDSGLVLDPATRMDLEPLPPEAGVVSSVACADLNGDGRLEIVVGTKTRDPVYDGGVFIFQRPRDTNSYKLVMKIPLNAHVNRVAVADLGNDGRLEVLAAATDYRRVLWVIPIQRRRGTELTMLDLVQQNTNVYDLLVADVNGDGAQDLLAGRGPFNGYDLHVWTNLNPDAAVPRPQWQQDEHSLRLGLVDSLASLGRASNQTLVVATAVRWYSAIEEFEEVTGETVPGHAGIDVISFDRASGAPIHLQRQVLRPRDKASPHEKVGPLQVLRCGENGSDFLLAWRSEPAENGRKAQASIWAAPIDPAGIDATIAGAKDQPPLGEALRVGGEEVRGHGITVDLDDDGDDELVVATGDGPMILGMAGAKASPPPGASATTLVERLHIDTSATADTHARKVATAACLMELGLHEQAAAELGPLVANPPEGRTGSLALELAARAEAALGRLERSREIFEHLADEYPERAVYALGQSARILEDAADYPRALEVWRRLLDEQAMSQSEDEELRARVTRLAALVATKPTIHLASGEDPAPVYASQARLFPWKNHDSLSAKLHASSADWAATPVTWQGGPIVLDGWLRVDGTAWNSRISIGLTGQPPGPADQATFAACVEVDHGEVTQRARPQARILIRRREGPDGPPRDLSSPWRDVELGVDYRLRLWFGARPETLRIRLEHPGNDEVILDHSRSGVTPPRNGRLLLGIFGSAKRLNTDEASATTVTVQKLSLGGPGTSQDPWAERQTTGAQPLPRPED